MIGLALAAATQIPKTVLGAFQLYQGFKGLKELNKQPEPNYTVSPEIGKAYQRAEGMTQMGIQPEQRAAFQQQLARTNNAARTQAVDASGGGLAQLINAGIGAQNIGAQNQFAADDALQRQRNIQYADSLASQVQQQKNMATATDIENRRAKEQAYGAAFKTGTENVAEGLSSFAGLASGLNGLRQPQGGGWLNNMQQQMDQADPNAVQRTAPESATANTSAASYNFMTGDSALGQKQAGWDQSLGYEQQNPGGGTSAYSPDSFSYNLSGKQVNPTTVDYGSLSKDNARVLYQQAVAQGDIGRASYLNTLYNNFR